MNFLGEWIKHIVLLILLATFMDLILPNSSMRKYVKLVVGFLLILLILSPILQLFQFDHERLLYSLDQLLQTDVQDSERQIKQQTEKIEELQSQLLQEDLQARWKAELKASLETQLAVEVAEIQLQLGRNKNQLDVQTVSLTLAPSASAQDQAEEVSDQLDSKQTQEVIKPVKEVEAVREVRITVSAQEDQTAAAYVQTTAEQKKIEKEVLKWLQAEWNISVDKIHIAWLRG